MTRKFKISQKAAKEIGSLYNTIACAEIQIRDNLARQPYDAASSDRASERAQNAARTLLVEYGIVAIGYFKHDDLIDYRNGKLDLGDSAPADEPGCYLSRSNGMWRVISGGLPICVDKQRRYEAERAAEQMGATPNQKWFWNGDDSRWSLLSNL